MKTKRILSLIMILALLVLSLTGCGKCKHNYQERDGRVICLECKEVCSHTYQVDGNSAYCTNCLFSCKHSSYSESNGEMVCDQCGLKCNHNYEEKDELVICSDCKKVCSHTYQVDGDVAYCTNCLLPCKHNSYTESNGEMVCDQCGLKCNHKFASKDGEMVCEHCQTVCIHDFSGENGGNKICTKCGYEKVMLTIDNINDYFTVNIKVYDVVIKDNFILGNDIGNAKIDIIVSSKKNIKYDNVVLTVVLKSRYEEWLGAEREVEVSYDGTALKTTSTSSRTVRFVPDNPSFDVMIVNVTGEIAD